MARLSREFVKLETRILNDYRFFRMSEFEQLTYLKLLGIARTTQNKIPKNLSIIGDLLRTNRSGIEIESALKQIKENFPKFKQNKYFYYFDEYELRMNKSVPSNDNNSCIEEDEDKEEDIEEDIERKKNKKREGIYFPTLTKVMEYFEGCGYAKDDAENFWSYYDSLGWETSRGAIIKNWQSKVIGWMNNQKQFNKDKEQKSKEGIVIEKSYH